MRVLRYALVILVLAGALYGIYRMPAVNVLFKPVEKNDDPLGFLRDLPEPEPRPVPEKSPSRKSGSAQASSTSNGASSEPQTAELPENQVPNSEVSRILIQILKARGLADGISISVTDQDVLLYGKVDSQEILNQIVEIANKAREYRSVNAESVTIASE